MLKIKDNVDLKELEKFGFEKENFQYVINNCKNIRLKSVVVVAVEVHSL